MCEDKYYYVFTQKLTWYFIGDYIIRGYNEFYIEFLFQTTYLFQTHNTWNSLLVRGTFGLLWFRIWP